MADHDHSYKNLFSHARLVRDLLHGFIREQWVSRLDMDTLERVNGTYVSDDLREREDDIIWRVRLADSWVYIYLLIEFQIVGRALPATPLPAIPCGTTQTCTSPHHRLFP